MKSSVYPDISPCSPLKVNRLFGGKYWLHLQDRRISKGRNRTKQTGCACYMLHYGFLPGLLFEPEDGGDMFVRNVTWLYSGLRGVKSQTIELFFSNVASWKEEEENRRMTSR
jgi:hypothetical protein